MGAIRTLKRPSCELEPPKRNRYFYGKLLDAYHFELETDYFNSKRRLLNRLVTGYGVVCGLDVTATADGEAVVVHPGLAIDAWGREIVVDRESPPIPIPSAVAEAADAESEPAYHGCYECREQAEDEHWAHLVLCYHECEIEPAPALAGDCAHPEPCQAAVISERLPGLLPARLRARLPRRSVHPRLHHQGTARLRSPRQVGQRRVPALPQGPVHPAGQRPRRARAAPPPLPSRPDRRHRAAHRVDQRPALRAPLVADDREALRPAPQVEAR